MIAASNKSGCSSAPPGEVGCSNKALALIGHMYSTGHAG